MQTELEDKKHHSVWFESGVWSSAEKSYDADKQECHVVLKVLKKFYVYVYKMHFTLEVDTATLVHQLNHAAINLSDFLVTQWIAWIQLFDFTAWHVSDHKNAAADGLSVTASTNHHQLAAMAASYTLHVTLLAQTHDRTVDSHSPSRFVDSPFLQTWCSRWIAA